MEETRVTHELARFWLTHENTGAALRVLAAYVDQCEARQKQAEREVMELKENNETLRSALVEVNQNLILASTQTEKELRATLQGKDEEIAGLRAERDALYNMPTREKFVSWFDRQSAQERCEIWYECEASTATEARAALEKVRAERDELSRKLEAAELLAAEYRAGARYETERCDQLLEERNRARNETTAALEKLEAAEREVKKLRAWHESDQQALAVYRERFGYNSPDQPPPAKPLPRTRVYGGDAIPVTGTQGAAETNPLTRDDVKAIVAEVAERANGRGNCDEPALLKLAEAAKEESGG